MTLAAFDKTAAYFPDVCFKTPPDLGILLGSGWGDSLAADEVLFRASYSDIPGIGDKRRRMLMRSFDSIDEVKNATAKEIALRTDFPMNVATSVYEFFHKNDE